MDVRDLIAWGERHLANLRVRCKTEYAWIEAEWAYRNEWHPIHERAAASLWVICFRLDWCINEAKAGRPEYLQTEWDREHRDSRDTAKT